MIFADTHTHLHLDDYDADRGAVLQSATEAGVAAVFDVGLDIKSNRMVLDEAERYPGVFAIVGFHPNETKHFDAKEFADFLEEAAGRYIALGEFGLDYYRDRTPPATQRAALEKQLEICVPLGLPLVFHVRQSERDALAMLRAVGRPFRGVMHCFSGDMEFLDAVLALGLHVAVGGPATYPKNDALREIVRAVPDGRLLLETDCPFLAPQKYRGKRNEPAYIPLIAEKFAEVRRVAVDRIAELTTRNVIDLFGGQAAEFLEEKLKGSVCRQEA
jgi:TatD DNase family protein